MIGHSRGASVVSELVRLASGTMFDQVTTLDPHPIRGGLCAFGDQRDGLVSRRSNVRFWDNYYQSGTVAAGARLNGAFNVNLNSGFYDAFGDGINLVNGHSWVHYYYAASIKAAKAERTSRVDPAWQGGVVTVP